MSDQAMIVKPRAGRNRWMSSDEFGELAKSCLSPGDFSAFNGRPFAPQRVLSLTGL